MIVVINYFTKYIEVEPKATITARQIQKILLKEHCLQT